MFAKVKINLWEYYGFKCPPTTERKLGNSVVPFLAELERDRILAGRDSQKIMTKYR